MILKEFPSLWIAYQQENCRHLLLSPFLLSFESDLVIETFRLIEAKRINLVAQDSLSMEAAKSVLSTLKCQFGPLNVITSQAIPWGKIRFTNKLVQGHLAVEEKKEKTCCWTGTQGCSKLFCESSIISICSEGLLISLKLFNSLWCQY